MDEGKEKREEAVLVRDKAGNFYRIPASALTQAIGDPKELEDATKEWSREEDDVEGQRSMPRPWTNPVPRGS